MSSNISNTTSAAPSSEAKITGTIEFQDVREPATNATVYVRLQESSRADAPATTVGEQVLRGVNIAPGMEPLPFEVSGIPQDPSGRYTVRAHADVNNSGVVSRGDYVSTQSYPVEISGNQAAVSVVARPVR